jgi:hypothetical protein
VAEPMAMENTDPPLVRCEMCGGRARWWRERWIECRGDCCWSSHDPRRTGLWWRFRVWIGR